MKLAKLKEISYEAQTLLGLGVSSVRHRHNNHDYTKLCHFPKHKIHQTKPNKWRFKFNIEIEDTSRSSELVGSRRRAWSIAVRESLCSCNWSSSWFSRTLSSSLPIPFPPHNTNQFSFFFSFSLSHFIKLLQSFVFWKMIVNGFLYNKLICSG